MASPMKILGRIFYFALGELKYTEFPSITLTSLALLLAAIGILMATLAV
jgi:hypothetical protein